jgi:hypothetical protein
MRRSLTFAAVALLFGVAYVLITPIKAMTGRLGLADVVPPAVVTAVLLVLLVAVGLFNGPSLPLRVRVAIGAIAAAIFVAILTYLYVTSSIAGGTTIEGTHGRYILPALPMILCRPANPPAEIYCPVCGDRCGRSRCQHGLPRGAGPSLLVRFALHREIVGRAADADRHPRACCFSAGRCSHRA